MLEEYRTLRAESLARIGSLRFVNQLRVREKWGVRRGPERGRERLPGERHPPGRHRPGRDVDSCTDTPPPIPFPQNPIGSKNLTGTRPIDLDGNDYAPTELST